MRQKPAQKGFAHPLLLVGVGVVGLIILLTATGALRFNASFKVNKPSQPQETVPPPAATPAPAPAKPQSEAKVKMTAYQGTGFTISYPEGWLQQAAKNMVTFSHKNPDGGIVLVKNPIGNMAGAKLATIADANKLVAKQQFKNSHFLSETETTLNGQPAWKYELKANNDGTDIRVVYYVLASPQSVYILIGTAGTSDWAKIEADLNTSLATFKFSD